jgi:hypothetical protein
MDGRARGRVGDFDGGRDLVDVLAQFTPNGELDLGGMDSDSFLGWGSKNDPHWGHTVTSLNADILPCPFVSPERLRPWGAENSFPPNYSSPLHL